MSRWRPPEPDSSPYITAVGFNSLNQELQELWEKRKEVTAALSAAAAEGDRSENAEYIYRKKQLREMDRRIGYLQKRIPLLKVVTNVESIDRIYFGAKVSLLDKDNNEFHYHIVGADELDPELGQISIDAPLARSLLGRMVDDEIFVELAEGKVCYVITAISYEHDQ